MLPTLIDCAGPVTFTGAAEPLVDAVGEVEPLVLVWIGVGFGAVDCEAPGAFDGEPFAGASAAALAPSRGSFPWATWTPRKPAIEANRAALARKTGTTVGFLRLFRLRFWGVSTFGLIAWLFRFGLVGWLVRYSFVSEDRDQSSPPPSCSPPP